DGDLDLVTANDSNELNRVWLNTGGVFTDRGQALGGSNSFGIALGDLDADGDVDAFIADFDAPNRVWLNQGCTNGITDVTLSVTGSPDEVDLGLGNTLTYTIVVTNAGPIVATNVIVTNRLPAGLILNVAVPAPVSQIGDTLVFDLGDLAPFTNASMTIDLMVSSNTLRWITNRVSVTTDSVEGNPLNNGAETVNIVSHPFRVAASTPVGSAIHVPGGQAILIRFNDPVDSGTIDPSRFTVRGQKHGVYPGSFTLLAPDRIRFAPDSDFLFGERVEVTLSGAIQSLRGDTLEPHTFQFHAAALSCAGAFFVDNGQRLGVDGTLNLSGGVALGDLNGDGHLDAFVANFSQANRIWFNDGFGQFTESGQTLGSRSSSGVVLGDLDGDGDQDAWVINALHDNWIWINDGAGGFSEQVVGLGAYQSLDVKLADLDGDGDLDAALANPGPTPNHILWNDGAAGFSIAGPSLGVANARGLALGDVAGDGDLDALFASPTAENELWLNDGLGGFSDSGQTFGPSGFTCVRLGDLDGDGDADAVFGREAPIPGNRIWFN
ncbi:MAG: FG-GAP-like repeat-containing protein, partial [Verrucomicrobiota bacterium]